MSKILVDSSVWISFLKGNEEGKLLFPLLDSNQACVNDLILTELLPANNKFKNGWNSGFNHCSEFNTKPSLTFQF
jgi:hypothetical protein